MRLSLFEPRLCDLFGVNRNMNKLIYWLIDHRYRLSTHSVPVILCSVYRLCMFIGSLCKTRSLLKTVRFSSELLRENLTPSLIQKTRTPLRILGVSYILLQICTTSVKAHVSFSLKQICANIRSTQYNLADGVPSKCIDTRMALTCYIVRQPCFETGSANRICKPYAGCPHDRRSY